MKTLKVIAVISLIVLGAIAFAQADSKDIVVQANVPYGSASCEVKILKFSTPIPRGQNPWTWPHSEPVGLVMNYGELTHTYTNQQGQPAEAGLWYSRDFFGVWIYANSFGHAYQLNSHFEGLQGATHGRQLPTDCMSFSAVYWPDDKWDPNQPETQGPQPSGSEVPYHDQTVSAQGDRIIYVSEVQGSNHILQAWYGLPTYDLNGNEPFPGWARTGKITLDYPQDFYRGTLTISIVEAQ